MSDYCLECDQPAEWCEGMHDPEVFIRQVQVALAHLQEIKQTYGDEGVVAWFLGVPVEDIWRVSGGRNGMAYVRFGPNSDVFLRATIREEKQVILCWGCLFHQQPASPVDWTDEDTSLVTIDYPWFDSKAETVTHLESHLEAGHKVPLPIIQIIKLDGWVK